jgi:hypothetical protein
MKRQGITYNIRGLDAMIDALRDIEKVGIPRAKAALDRALGQTFEVSQELVHVSDDPRHAGSLRESGEYYSESSPREWKGTITYEGDRGAAGYEMQRGGEHAQFINDLAIFAERPFEEAIDEAYRSLFTDRY